MVQVRYYLAVYINNNIPIRVEYKTRAGVVVGESVFKKVANNSDEDEYYAEYDSLGLFVYVKTKTNKCIKKHTWVQDFKDVDGNIQQVASDYKPKTTIKYIITTSS